MIISAAIDPYIHRLSFYSESQLSELLEVLVSAAESIGRSTASATNETNDAPKSVEPPSKKCVYCIFCLMRKSRIMS